MSSLDSHTLQWLQGYNMGPDGRLLHWYNQLAYDGLDLPTWKEDLSSWTAQGEAAGFLKTDLVNVGAAEGWRTYLLGECTERLLRCLDLGKETLLRSGKRGP